jgi:hypothetical protein
MAYPSLHPPQDLQAPPSLEQRVACLPFLGEDYADMPPRPLSILADAQPHPSPGAPGKS